MAWFSLLSLAAKTGLHVYENRQYQKRLMSDAARLHAEKMAQGKIEFSGKVLEAQDKGFKDEIVSSTSFFIILIVFQHGSFGLQSEFLEVYMA